MLIYASSESKVFHPGHSLFTGPNNIFHSHMAESCGVIFFNVDYRLAPEAKCPENVKDFYSALKYVVRIPHMVHV